MVYRRSADESFKRLVVKAKYGDEEAAMELLGFRPRLPTKQRGETVLESATNDISSYEFKIDGMRLISARYTDDRDRIVWYDPDLKAHQEALDDAVKDRENWIASRSKDNKMMLVLSGASFDPGRYYIYQPEGWGDERADDPQREIEAGRTRAIQIRPLQGPRRARHPGLSHPAEGARRQGSAVDHIAARRTL